jgi:hypothetical protein
MLWAAPPAASVEAFTSALLGRSLPQVNYGSLPTATRLRPKGLCRPLYSLAAGWRAIDSAISIVSDNALVDRLEANRGRLLCVRAIEQRTAVAAARFVAFGRLIISTEDHATTVEGAWQLVCFHSKLINVTF